jgi:metallo-beta-lactamase family protein
MMTGVRILHHVKQYGPGEKSTNILTGFQAHKTRGARLLEQAKQLKIHGKMVPIRTQVISLSSTSAHADYQEILDWLSGFKTLPKTSSLPMENFMLHAHLKPIFLSDFILKR